MPNFLDAFNRDTFPLPPIRTYTSASFLALSIALYYAFQMSSEPGRRVEKYLFIDDVLHNNETNSTSIVFENDTIRYTFFKSLLQHQNESIAFNEILKNPTFLNILNIAYIMVHEPLCVGALINMCYCLLFLFYKIIQRLVFGELRNSEQQLLRDRFWNFLLYKFIFVFSVINVQSMDELIIWCSWFSVLGFMYLLSHLCKERFSFLTYSPSVSKWEHFKLLTLLILILIPTIPLSIISVLIGLHSSFSYGAFLVSEVLLLFLRTLHCLTLYLVHIWDLTSDSIWEKRTAIIYYIELTFDLLILSIDFCHHLHMLLWANIILSVSSLVILLQLKQIFYDIIKRITKHRNYLQVLNLMEENFPMATQDELTDENSDCAICWDRMENARRLPCNHLFHATCLRSWLEQDTSCPTCRHSLRQRSEEEIINENVPGNDNNRLPGNNNNNNNTSFFHFDGQRYARWLPSVSVEVTRPNMIDININTNLTGINRNEILPEFAQQQIEYMGQQVLEWFPQFSLTAILEDLRNTRSVEHTIENILDGRLSQSTSTSSPSTNTSNTVDNNTDNQIVSSSNNNLLFENDDNFNQHNRESSDENRSDYESDE